MFYKTLIFLAGAGAMYLLATVAFALVCWIGGHNAMESIFGGWTAIILPLAAGAQVLYLSTLR